MRAYVRRSNRDAAPADYMLTQHTLVRLECALFLGRGDNAFGGKEALR